MIFINLSGVEMDPVVYAVAAIVLLPINSALNPILYSNFLDKCIIKVWKSKSSLTSQRSKTTTATVSYTTTNHNQFRTGLAHSAADKGSSDNARASCNNNSVAPGLL